MSRSETHLDPGIPALGRDSLAEAIANFRACLRPGQQELADWLEGPLAVSAVPGSGKSYGMAVAAAIAIARNQPNRSRQLVVVTFTRSAAASIKTKIRENLRQLGLPQGGFAVHTLHGLALQIATRHPQLSGLRLETATLVTPQQSHRLIRTCVDQWLGKHPQLYQQLLEGQQFDGEETERLRRQSVLRTEVLPNLAQTIVREAKSSGLSPQDLYPFEQVGDGFSILAIAAGLYEHYQQLLKARGWIDYDEMVLAALRVLENSTACRLWQDQIYAVFEDEAQDSSPLQTKLLKKLAADSTEAELHHLVRVGDPNQAINSTFTPADPIFFRQFCQDCQALDRLAVMDQAGRSSQVIIDAANFLMTWANQLSRADKTKATTLPFRTQTIHPVHPVSLRAPQPEVNPKPEGQGLEVYTPHDVYHTVELIAERTVALFEQNPQAEAAVLVRENKQGRFVAEVLRNPDQYSLKADLGDKGIHIYEVGEQERRSQVPAEILALLQFLDRPHSPDNLKAALGVLIERQLIPKQDLNAFVGQPEQFLYPGPLDPPLSAPVRQAANLCCQLLRARLELPHYQLIPFLALALQYDQAELATADKLATRVTQQAVGNHSMGGTLPVLAEIVSSEKFEPVEVDAATNRYVRPGQLTIITMHKAKGLDWDYVFLPFLHEDTIPGSLWVPTSAKFLGEFTLAEVARAQIRASLHQQGPLPDIAAAWQQAGDLKTAEEFRLLYVAMTRAKRLLWMSAAQQGPYRWGGFNWQRRDSLQTKKPCPFLQPLKAKFPHSKVPCQAYSS